jgi:hypothetical protein
MARAKKTVTAVVSRRDGETLFSELLRDDASGQHLADMVGRDIDDQVGPWVVLEMTKRDAEKMAGKLAASHDTGRIDPVAFTRMCGAIGFASALIKHLD